MFLIRCDNPACAKLLPVEQQPGRGPISFPLEWLAMVIYPSYREVHACRKECLDLAASSCGHQPTVNPPARAEAS